MSNELVQYMAQVAIPALALLCFSFCVPKMMKPLRIFSLMLLFILFRDTMTPTGLWKITSGLEIRFIDQPLTLWLLALSSMGLVFLSYFLIGGLGSWNKRSLSESIIVGLGAGVLVAIIQYLFSQWTRQEASPRPEGAVLLIAIAALAFLGNTLEEVIFRGHFQNYLNECKLSNTRVVFLSAGAFSVCHSFLAFTLTSIGWPILVFTFYEGTICAYLRQRNGLLSATLAHGMGLFLILSGTFG